MSAVVTDTRPAIARLPDGLHADVAPAVYHERVLGMVSNSALKEIDRTPLHYKAWVDGLVDTESTPALEFGSAYHCAQLEPGRFLREYAVAPDFGDRRFKEAKANYARWKEDNGGKTLLDADDAKRISGMVTAVRAHPLTSKMLREGEPELTMLWTDEETKLRCRARADFYVRSLRMAVDVKSAADASPEAFRRSVFNYKYHWQHAHYRAGFAALGEHVDHFVFVVVEKDPPHAIAIYTLDSLGVVIAHDKVRMLTRKLAACIESNEWPGYSASIETIETPSWVE